MITGIHKLKEAEKVEMTTDSELLIKIISIVKYGANTSSEISECKEKSEVYLKKIIKAVPLKESIRRLEWYQIPKSRTPEEQDNLFSSLLANQTKLLQQAYDQLSRGDRNNFLDCLKEMNASLKIDPVFIVFLVGLPFSEFLYESNQERSCSLLQNVMGTLDQMTISIDKEDSGQSMKYLNTLRQELSDYLEKSYPRRQKYIPLPDDEFEF